MINIISKLINTCVLAKNWIHEWINECFVVAEN